MIFLKMIFALGWHFCFLSCLHAVLPRQFRNRVNSGKNTIDGGLV